MSPIESLLCQSIQVIQQIYGISSTNVVSVNPGHTTDTRNLQYQCCVSQSRSHNRYTESSVPMLCQSIQVTQQIHGIFSTNVVSVNPGHTTDTRNLQYQCCVSQSRSHNRYTESAVPMLCQSIQVTQQIHGIFSTNVVSVNPGHTTDTRNLQYQCCVSQSRSHNRYTESSVPMLCQSIQVTQQIHGIFSTNVVSVNPGHTTDTRNLQYQCCVSQSRSHNRYTESSVPMLCQSIQVTQQIHEISSTNVVSVNPGHTTDTRNLQYQCCVSQSRSHNRYTESAVPMLCQSIQVIQQIHGICSTNVVSVNPGHTTDTRNLQYQCCVSQSRSHNRYTESSVPMLCQSIQVTQQIHGISSTNVVSVNPGHTTDTWNLQYQCCVSQSRSHNRYMESPVPMLCQSIQVTQQIHGIFSTNVVSVNPGHTTDTWNLQYQCCVSQSRSHNRYMKSPVPMLCQSIQVTQQIHGISSTNVVSVSPGHTTDTWNLQYQCCVSQSRSHNRYMESPVPMLCQSIQVTQQIHGISSTNVVSVSPGHTTDTWNLQYQCCVSQSRSHNRYMESSVPMLCQSVQVTQQIHEISSTNVVSVNPGHTTDT